MADFQFVLKHELFQQSLALQQGVLRDFHARAAALLEHSGITLSPLPEDWLDLRRNYFSVLFLAVLIQLGIPPARLPLYGLLNHCLRTWVTCCDNLLDDELKEMLLSSLPPEAHIFKSVHTLMLADRIFFSALMEARSAGVFTEAEVARLVRISLDAVTRSGLQEASEEGGVTFDLPPEDLLRDVHTLKTGYLFISPLAAPAELEGLAGRGDYEAVRQGLIHFGVGCQILDDLTDLGQDLTQRNHNYLVAVALHGDSAEERALMRSLLEHISPADAEDQHLYQRFEQSMQHIRTRVRQEFTLALEGLRTGGLPFTPELSQAFINGLMLLFEQPSLLLNLRSQGD